MSMSEPISESTPEPSGQEPEREPDWRAEAEKWKSLSRKNEDAAKANAAKAKEYDSYREAQKTDEQRRQDEIQATARERDEARSELARAKAALKYKLADEDLDLLGTGSPEEIDARAKRLSERLAPPPPNYDGGARTPAPGGKDMNSVIRKAAGLG